MNTTLLSRTLPATAAALGMAALLQVGCGRDNQASASAGSAPPSTPASTQRVELTGCLSRGTIPGSFVLDTTGSDNGSSAVGTSGSGSDRHTADATGNGARYTIFSLEGRNLDAYVGKRVSVAGRFAAATDRNAGGPDASRGSTGNAGGPGVGDNGQMPVPVPQHGDSGATAASGAASAQRDMSGIPVRQVNADNVRVVQDSCGAGADQRTGRR